MDCNPYISVFQRRIKHPVAYLWWSFIAKTVNCFCFLAVTDWKVTRSKLSRMVQKRKMREYSCNNRDEVAIGWKKLAGTIYLHSMCKIPKFHLISWCGNFVKTHSFRRVSGDSSETLQKLCIFTKYKNQEIRWNFGILCSDFIFHINKHNISLKKTSFY